MTDRPSGNVAGSLLALSLGLVAILGLMCVGVGFFFASSTAPVPVAGPGTTTGTSGFGLHVSGVNRLPDGSYNIFLVGSITGLGEIGQIHIEDVRLTDVPNGDCTIKLPPGPPYAQSLDYVVHTRPLPPEQNTVQLNLAITIDDAEHHFEMSHSITMKVDLKAAPPVEPAKATIEAEAGPDDFPLQPAVKSPANAASSQ